MAKVIRACFVGSMVFFIVSFLILSAVLLTGAPRASAQLIDESRIFSITPLRIATTTSDTMTPEVSIQLQLQQRYTDSILLELQQIRLQLAEISEKL